MIITWGELNGVVAAVDNNRIFKGIKREKKRGDGKES
jgi:hypothetical protein